MQRDQNGLVEAVALEKKKSLSRELDIPTRWVHLKLRFFWLVKETITAS